MSEEKSESSIKCSPIALDVAVLFKSACDYKEAHSCTIRTAFQHAFDSLAFQDIHFCMYRPFSIDPNNKERQHFVDMCSDACEEHNDWVRVLYGHIIAYFNVTSWLTHPLYWALTLELLFAMHSTILLPHGCSKGDEKYLGHAKFRIPLSPHIVRQLRLFATFCADDSIAQAGTSGTSTDDALSIPTIGEMDRVSVVQAVIALDNAGMIRITPAVDCWYGEDILRAHSRIGAPIELPHA